MNLRNFYPICGALTLSLFLTMVNATTLQQVWTVAEKHSVYTQPYDLTRDASLEQEQQVKATFEPQIVAHANYQHQIKSPST